MNAKEKLMLAGGVVGLAVLWYVVSKAGQVPGAIGSVFSGNNVITGAARTDAYAGNGIAGTLGAAADISLGGLLSRTGEWWGSHIYDWTHSGE